MNELFVYLNILTLLKREPKRFKDFWESGYFRHEWELEIGLVILLNANCIERYGPKKLSYYGLLGNGLKFLEFYPKHEMRLVSLKLQSEGIIIPIGRQSDERF